MITAVIAAILFVFLVSVTLLGRRVSRYLPEDQLSADSRDAVKLAMGFIATMTAVLLGLLITSAKGNFDTEQSEVMQMAAKVAFLNRVLVVYGPEAADARLKLRDAVADGGRRSEAVLFSRLPTNRWVTRFTWPSTVSPRTMTRNAP